MKNKKILIADDDPAIVEVLTLILEEGGYETVSTVDGQTVKDLKEHLPDLLLLDLWMSGIDGRDICMHLKKQELTKHIPIVILSACNNTQEIAKKAGADDFILKPFQMDNLLAVIKKNIS